MKLTFWGAAQTVTGSMHMIEASGKRILLDCGLYQGRRKEAEERNRSLPFQASDIDSVVLSHAHIDHSGNLPTLTRHGFRGTIHSTPATADLCEAMLKDSAVVQERDAEFANRRHRHRRQQQLDDRNPEAVPLYTVEDAEITAGMFRDVRCHTHVPLAPDLGFRFHEAGHMLGSASVYVEHKSNGKTLRLGFSGDVGRVGLPIIRDPEPLPQVDYLILESTYGDRFHKPLDQVSEKLADAVARTAARGGKIIAPAFAVGRTQQLVVMLHNLVLEKRLPNIPIYVDSPLAVNVTEVFRKHANLFDADMQHFLDDGADPFGFNMLRYVRASEDSKKLNDIRGPFLVISASGMCEAGRILHHLRNNVEDGRNLILITGFQAEHTLGRKIVDKMPMVPIFGDLMNLRAEVVKINELSGHADQGELLQWIKPIAGGLKTIFLVHGEPLQQRALAEAIQREYRIPVTIPARGDSFDLD